MLVRIDEGAVTHEFDSVLDFSDIKA